MNENDAKKLVLAYVEGWKHNDIEQICSALMKDCIVTESHGPTYHGTNEIRSWFKLWLDANSLISHWNITSHHFCADEGPSFIQWDFSCISNEKNIHLMALAL